jgi:hypothetical protein
LSESHVIPDLDVKTGDFWNVPANCFQNMLDPSILAYTSGEVNVEVKSTDQINLATKGREIALIVSEGRINYSKTVWEGSKPSLDEVGFFEPRGKLSFSKDQRIITSAKLTGNANFVQRSLNHWVFEMRAERRPDVTIDYKCRVVGTPEGNK